MRRRNELATSTVTVNSVLDRNLLGGLKVAVAITA
jgi:hypothetical protein